MLAASQRLDRDVAMVVNMRRDADRVDVGIGQQVAVVGVPLLDLMTVGHFGQSFGPPGTQGRQFDVRHLGQVVGMDLAEPTQTDHSPADAVR